MPKKSDSKPLLAEIRAADPGWEPGVTSVSELSAEEKILHLGYVPGPGEMSLAERESTASALYAALNATFEAPGAPAAYDLRNVGGKNFITSVKNQASCGSCVAFGCCATVEGTLRVQRNDPNLAIDLSEAHLFYCHARAQGRRCAGASGGWWVPPALDCFKSPGVADEPCYPYVAGDQNCTNLCSTWQSRVTKVTNWRAMNSPADMKTWLSTKGPLVACYTVYDDFYQYRSGIYRHVAGALLGGHCVSVVGYDDNGRFWICKNSWGAGWGESGFFRIAYGEVGIDATMWGVEGVVTPSPGPTPGQRLPLYRYWNPGIADHFYTTNWSELGTGRYGWGYEGIQCYVLGQAQTGTLPLYRYWNPSIGDHFYTTNWAELGGGRYGWFYEGIQCYVFGQPNTGTVPLYRYWNPAAADHFYTTNWGELGPGRYGWYYEGVQCYVFAQASSASGAEEAEMSEEGPAEVPSSFSVAGTGKQTPTSFSVGGESAESGPPASFASTGTAGESSSTEPSGSFKVEETKKSGRITITIDPGGG